MSVTSELYVIHEECTEMNYGIIIGQETMRKIDLDTSIRDNMISSGDGEIAMVPRGYWNKQQIVQQQARLSKQP